MIGTQEDFFKGKNIMVTGHTGFMGAWLTQWLIMLRANVCGYALDPPSQPNIYDSLHLSDQLLDVRGDITDASLLRKTISNFNPEIVFHLAAQPIVLESYDDPVKTFESNVTGTAILLDELRKVNTVKAIVVVTSDKSYKNNEWVYPYRENDVLGGRDPYSASKSCQDIVVESFRDSYFTPAGISLSSVRAGNVIAGGDWGKYRIVPDLVRGIVKGQSIEIRNPNSIRPWQYVLEPISGMMLLVQKMYEDINFSGAWNFGPNIDRSVTVMELVDKFIKYWGKGKYDIQNSIKQQEANFLRLDTSKAMSKLNWFPHFDFDITITQTVDWYKLFYSENRELDKFTQNQINYYSLYNEKKQNDGDKI